VNDTMVTVIGNVADAPRRNNTPNGTVTNFRMASTARRYDAAQDAYVDSGTLWIDVECWGALSGNVAASISKGDPVIVRGALTTHRWESDAGPRSKTQLRAFAVGPNLQKGRALFTRDKSARADEAPGTPVPREGGADFAQLDAAAPPAREYTDEGLALHSVETDDLQPEPAHA
jgi:single-strand DNA-binding protein